jgi:serine/threonine protein kinase
MGVVYRGEHIQLGTSAAVKLIHPHFSQRPEFIERFKREAKTMMELMHPHLVHVYEVGVAGETYYMVMEYVGGGSLMVWRKIVREMPESAVRPSVGKVLQVMVEVCDGLGYAHQRGYIHRDLKPSNILFDKEKRAKISDFGLVKILGGEAISMGGKMTAGIGSGVTEIPTADGIGGLLTMTGAQIGTFDYMSPEQREGRKEIDARTDIYSIGVMLYELLTGKLPVGRVKEPSAYNPRVNTELDEVVLRALESAPRERYSSVEVLRGELARVAEVKWAEEERRKREVEEQREEEARRRQEAFKAERQRILQVFKLKQQQGLKCAFWSNFRKVTVLLIVFLLPCFFLYWLYRNFRLEPPQEKQTPPTQVSPEVMQPQTIFELISSTNELGEAQNVTVNGNYAYVLTSAGISIVDITDPTKPTRVSYYNSYGYSIKDVCVSGELTHIKCY